MNRAVAAGLAAIVAASTGGCQNKPQDARQLNKQYADSKVYLGALT